MKNQFLAVAVLFSATLVSCGREAEPVGGTASPAENAAPVPESDPGVLEIAELQSKHGPEFVTTLDCSKYSDIGKEYCETEKKKYPSVGNPSDLGFSTALEAPPTSLSGKVDDGFQKTFGGKK